MKRTNLKTFTCDTFSRIKQLVSKKISKMGTVGKIITAIGLISGLITIFAFFTGKNLPDYIAPEDPTMEDKSDKNSDTYDDENNDSNDEKNSGVNIDVNVDGNININGDENNGVNIVVDPGRADTNEADTKKLTMAQSAYREALEQAIGSDMCLVADYYNDFNDDEYCEMYALVTTQEEANNYESYFDCGITGEIWFVNQSGAQKVADEMTYWSVSGPFPVADRKFIVCEEYYATGSCTYLWGVNQAGDPYQPNVSGKGHGLRIHNYEIELTCSDYDFSYSAELGILSGHTWKPYYFYWGGTNFKEYGGMVVAIEDVYSINGSKELLEQTYSELRNSFNDIQITEIYYRENGIININYQCRVNSSDIDYNNYTATLRYEDGILKIIPWEDFDCLCREGKYESAFIPSIATPPESSFESLFG